MKMNIFQFLHSKYLFVQRNREYIAIYNQSIHYFASDLKWTLYKSTTVFAVTFISSYEYLGTEKASC